MRSSKFEKPLLAVLLGLALLGLIFDEAGAQGLVGLFELEGGARPAAMGGAFVGLAEGQAALYYNPAGLASLRELILGGLFESRFARAGYGTLGLALPNLGAEFLFLGLGGVTRRDEQGIPLGELPYRQIGLLVGGGLRLADLGLGDLPLAAGLQLKLYRVSTLPEGSGTAFSLSPGLLWSEERLELGGIPLQRLRLGLLAPNLLSLGITYGSGHHESWGPGLRLGAAAALPEGLTFAFDLEASGAFHLGGEWRLSGLEMEPFGLGELSLRLGLKNVGSILSPSLGFGLRVGDFQIDYAFLMHPELAGVHRIEFAAVFGPPNALLCALRPKFCPPDDPLLND